LEAQNDHQPIIEALLFASEKPLSAEQIQAVIKDITFEQIDQAISLLNERYRSAGHSFAIKKVGRGFRMYTLPDFAPWIKALFSHNRRERLSPQALEVLSIIAYKQPIVRTEIDRLRGVNSDGPLSTLLDRKLITIVGRKPSPGRPLLYGTTQEFLTHFGLNDVDDLPKMGELEKILKVKEPPSFAEEMSDKLTEERREKQEQQPLAREEPEAEIPPQIPAQPPSQALSDDEAQ
jgi:segregation and condensation protein B